MQCVLCLMSDAYHKFTHHSATLSQHMYVTIYMWFCTSVLDSHCSTIYPHTLCQRLDTQDPSPTYLKLPPHKPDEERRSHMLLSRILNHLQHDLALHPLQKKGLCLQENWTLTMITMITPQIKCPSDQECLERWVYKFTVSPIKRTGLFRHKMNFSKSI